MQPPQILRKEKQSAMTQSYQTPPPPGKERASAPGTGASVTIEAAFGIPIFLFAVLCLIYLAEIQSIRISIINAAQSAAKSASEATAAVPMLNTVKLKSDIVKGIGEGRISRSILDGGSDGISCWKSYISPLSGEMHINVEYSVKLPIPALGNPSAKLKEEFKMSSWQGYEVAEMADGEGDIVYITPTGLVYHEDYQCSYLQLSIRFVPYTELEILRNLSGGIYHPCERCVYGSAMSGVYITEYGTKYHNSLNCSGLRRTIIAVRKSQVMGRGGCSKCTD